MTISSKLLVDYLIPRAKRLVVLDQPIRTDPDIRPIASTYFLRGFVDTYEYWGHKRVFKLADFMAALKAGNNDFDLFIAGEQLNGLAAWILGKRFVYVPADVSDFGMLHGFVKKRADYIWNLTVSLCPPIKEENYKPRDENVFGYLGALEPRFSVDKAIKALPYILKEVPDARMEIVGSGPQKEELEKMAKGLPVKFHGFLPDDEAVKVLLEWKAGVAPYSEAFPKLDSGKLRFYAWCGVPSVVSSLVPDNAALIEKFGCGWVKEPRPEAIAHGVLNLLIDGKGPRQACKAFAEAHDATVYFDRLFNEISV
jgi:glycosyltransferase involved in cell wall biosynthesis